VTLSVQARNVRIVPESSRANDNAPSHRVFVGRAEIGAAWPKRSNEGRDYLSVKLDDPSFNAPIYANLFDAEDGETFNLIWSRGRRQNGDTRHNAPPDLSVRGVSLCFPNAPTLLQPEPPQPRKLEGGAAKVQPSYGIQYVDLDAFYPPKS
jgi:uncharacterized protein (DUF736 family)